MLFFLSFLVGVGVVKSNVEADQIPPKVDITFQIENSPSGKCFLIGIYGEQNYKADSGNIVNGQIKLQRDQLYSGGMYYLLLPDQKSFLQVLIDSDQQFEMHTQFSGLINNMKVEGSADNELFYQNLKYEENYKKELEGAWTDEMKEELVEKRNAHIKEFSDNHPNSFFTQFKLAGQNPILQQPKLSTGELDEQLQVYLYRMDYWNDVDFSDERLLRTPVFHNKLKNFITKYVPQTVDSLIKYSDFLSKKSMANPAIYKYTVNYIGRLYKKPSFMGGDAVYVHMVENYFTKELAVWSNEYELKRLHLDAAIRKRSLPGMKAQDVKAKNSKGEYLSIHDIEAPITIVYIYTTSCDHCIEETPKLLEVYNQWKDKGIQIYAICTDQEEGNWKEFIAKNKIEAWSNVFDPTFESKYDRKYHIDITPEIYVLDQDKIIVGKDLKSFQLEEVFTETLNKD